jgi:hypothetical protein
MSVARFIADQRTMHRVPHAVTCAILGVSVSWFYKWVHRKPTPTEVRRSELDAGGQGRVRGVEAHLRVTAHPCRPRRGRLDGERKHGRRLDATTRPARSQTKAPQGNNQAGQDRAEVPGSAAPRLHRAGGECEVVWRHDRDPDQ